MLSRRRDAAPIYIRIRSGYQTDAPIVSAHPVTLARAFGSLERTIAGSPACDDDPDIIAKDLHSAYVEAGRAMQQEDPTFMFSGEAWEALPLTLQNANRQLHRHAQMKIEDLGGQWRPNARSVPIVDPLVRGAFMAIENAMNYAVVDEGPLPEKWWIDGKITPEADPEARERQRARAERVKGVAIKEHNRWTMSRALDGWVPAASTERRLRDSDRRVHNNMWPWSELDALTRRYDAVMLRALVGGSFQRKWANCVGEESANDRAGSSLLGEERSQGWTALVFGWQPIAGRVPFAGLVRHYRTSDRYRRRT